MWSVRLLPWSLLINISCVICISYGEVTQEMNEGTTMVTTVKTNQSLLQVMFSPETLVLHPSQMMPVDFNVTFLKADNDSVINVSIALVSQHRKVAKCKTAFVKTSMDGTAHGRFYVKSGRIFGDTILSVTMRWHQLSRKVAESGLIAVNNDSDHNIKQVVVDEASSVIAEEEDKMMKGEDDLNSVADIVEVVMKNMSTAVDDVATGQVNTVIQNQAGRNSSKHAIGLKQTETIVTKIKDSDGMPIMVVAEKQETINFRQRLTYKVCVVRTASQWRIQKVMSLITMILCVVAIFLGSCQLTYSSLSGMLPWLVASSLIQFILFPVLLLAIVTLFGTHTAHKLGLLTCVISPCSMLALPFGVILGADVPLLLAMMIVGMVMSNVAMPIWALQLGRLAHIHVNPRDVPFGMLVVFGSLMLLAILAGATIRHLDQTIADRIRRALYPFSVLVLAFSLGHLVFGGLNMFPSVEWRSGISSFTWVIAGCVTFVILLSCSSPVKSVFLKSVGVVLLARSSSVAILFLDKCLASPLNDVAIAAAYTFSLLSVFALTVMIIMYSTWRYVTGKDTDTNCDSTVNSTYITHQVDSENDPPPAYNSTAHTALIEQAMTQHRKAGTWGAPVMGWMWL